MYRIHMLPAKFGDSLLIEYGRSGEHHFILIDGGPYYAFDEILSTLKKKVPHLKKIELLVISHVDIDHIDGIIRLLNQKKPDYDIGEIWFNGFKELDYKEKDDLLGGVQGEYLSLVTKRLQSLHNKTFFGKPATIHRNEQTIKLKGGMEFIILNPTQKNLKKLKKAWVKHLKDNKVGDRNEHKLWEKLNGDHRYKPIKKDDLLGVADVESWANAICKEDKSCANRSSIAFIAKYSDKRCLFAADATSADLKSSLEKLNLTNEFGRISFDAWKLSHHGSKKSNQDYLMNMVKSRKILVSSDGTKYHHPDKETIAKLLVSNKQKNLNFYFNYKSKYNAFWNNQKYIDKFGHSCFFPNGSDKGYLVVDL